MLTCRSSLVSVGLWYRPAAQLHCVAQQSFFCGVGSLRASLLHRLQQCSVWCRELQCGDGDLTFSPLSVRWSLLSVGFAGWLRCWVVRAAVACWVCCAGWSAAWSLAGWLSCAGVAFNSWGRCWLKPRWLTLMTKVGILGRVVVCVLAGLVGGCLAVVWRSWCGRGCLGWLGLAVVLVVCGSVGCSAVLALGRSVGCVRVCVCVGPVPLQRTRAA